MRWNRICLGQRFITVLLFAIGLSAYGCTDSVSVSEDVQVPLASLTVTPGTLQPAFSRNTTNYTVNAPTSADKVTVAAIPKDNTVTVTINKTVTTHLSVTLGAPGSTTIIIIVLEAQNGTESTYTVTVTRLLSSDNNLSALDVTPGTLTPDFTPDTEDYTVNVGVLVNSVDVSATKSDPNAVMVINWPTGSITIGPGDNSPGRATIPLGGPGTATPVTIEVTAQNSSKKTYHITINKLSGNNDLKALSVVEGPLNPTFASGITVYTVDVGSDIDKVTISATKSDPNAAMSGSVTAGPGAESGTATLDLGGQGTSTDFFITVAAPDPSVPLKEYKITVHRATPAAPAAPTVAPDLIPEDDSGLFSDDNITNVTTPRFRIPQPGAGETPSLYVNGAKIDATFDQVANTLKPTAALSDGTYPITYTLANAGGESAQSPSLSVTIDTSFPLPL
ncbi:MAG: hypothetical protein OJF51_003238 [Nitrospira sp.]|jgi:hypothetical protein|nr:MAG: hypothetical protein OJF51_003238 [Nitrospira sp.]